MTNKEVTTSPWDEIKTPKREWAVRKIETVGNVSCFHGKNCDGKCLFIVELEGDHRELFKKNSFTPRGLTIDLVQSHETNIQRLVVELGDAYNQDLFGVLCRTLIEKIEHATKAASVVVIIFEHIKRWQAFLAQQNTKLSDEAQRGLFAELTFLQELLERTSHDHKVLVESWLGPEGAAQDYIVGGTSVEIKSISGSNRMRVSISSEDQLESPTEHLFLRIFRLNTSKKEDPKSRSLTGLIEELTNQLRPNAAALLCFEKKLASTGYLPLPDYDSPLLTVAETLSFIVGDEFPRLVRSTLPTGITKVSYELELEHLEASSCPHNKIFKEM